MEPDDDDDVTETSRIFVLGENGSVQHSETIKLYPVVPGHAGSVEDVSKVSDKNVRRSHSLGNVRFSLNDPLENSQDEGFLIGRREMSVCNLKYRTHSHIRITEVAPSNSAIINEKVSLDISCESSAWQRSHMKHQALFSSRAETEVPDSTWKVPVQLFTDKKRGKSKEDKKLSRRIRSYYKAQDEMISAFEHIQSDAFSDDASHLERERILKKRAERLAQLSFVVNLMLIIAKAVAVGLSSSIAIISSLVDSAVDLLSGIIIWWTSRAMKKKNIYSYPEGRSRLEPTAIVVLSVVMSLASFQLIINSIQKIVEFTSRNGTIPTVQLPVILIAAFTVVSKFVLFILCYCFGRSSSSVRALALDHRNDVLSNIVAIICGYLGSQEFMGKVGEYGVVYIDPIGAIIISIYILVNWWKTGYEQTKLLTGHTADPNFLSKITWICLNHHEDIVLIDTVRAFHFGNNFLVEVDIVLPEDMSLKESHNIGESLQNKLEKFPLVERAFVHLDYETTHHPHEEHKPI